MSNNTVICQYCGAKALLVTGDKIYNNYPEAVTKYFWRCPNDKCDAHVGAHHTSMKPIGPLANRWLRSLRIQTHKAFDPLWQSKFMTRSEAYQWLTEKMQLSSDECHIAKFGPTDCTTAILHIQEFKQKKRL